MGQKSVDLLKELREGMVSGRIRAEGFPLEDVMGLIRAEHETFFAYLKQEWHLHENFYNSIIKKKISRKDSAELIKIIDEIIFDLEEMPQKLGLSEEGKLIEERKRRYRLSVQEFKDFAKRAYWKQSFQKGDGLNKFNGKGVVYTVITGKYDVLYDPVYMDSGYDYICFTDDRELTSDVWSFRYIENTERLDDVRLSRKYKILCHEFLKEYDYSIYVDGKVQIIGSLRDYIEKYTKGNAMLCFPHFMRECAYAEAEVCMKLEKDDPQIILEQMEGYGQEGYPADNGLIDGACLVRSHRDDCLRKVMQCWWNEVRNKSRRDQLSIGYACWKNDFHYDLSDLYTYENEYLCKSRNEG